MVEGENSKQTTRTAAGTCRVPALPEGWITRVSRHYPDRVYYYNTATGASTWNMPGLDQSSSASGKKRKHHRHHHRKKGDVKQSDDRNQSTQHQQRLSTDDPDIDDEDCLDLMYESGGEPDSVSCTLAVDASEVKDRAPHALTADVSEVNCKKSCKETPDKKQKKKWKQLWDSSSGLKANSSSLEEERGLTAEELQIIRFPECKGSHGIKAIDATSQRIVSLHTKGETPAQTATSTLPAPSLPQQTSVSETSTPPGNLTSPAPDQVDKKKRRQRRRKKSTPDLETPLGNATSGILTPTVSPSDEKAPPLPNAFPITPDTPGKGRGLAGGGGACWGGREGEAAMEVDDAFYFDCQDSDEDQIMMDLQEFRENFRPEMKSEAVGVLTESVQKTQASRPTSPGPQPASARKIIYIVVDTNVLFGALGFLQVLRDMALKGYGHPFLVFPWVVLQELDGLKNSKTKSKTAQNAVRYIHSCLLSHHPRVRGQTPAQALESAESFPAQCNDDRVLQCCVQCQKKYGADFVLLLTDDLNLENKAVVMGITTFSSKRLQPLMDKPIHENEYPASKNVGVPTGGVHTPEVPQQRRVDPGRSTPVSTPMTASGGRQTPQGRGTISPVVETNQQNYQHRAMMEGLWKEAKCVVNTALSGVVQAEMKEAFGDLWLDVVIRKPPWSPLELVMVLQKHWIAVFGLKFDRGMKTVVDDLVKEFRQTRGGGRDLRSLTMCLQKCLLLVTSVNFVRPCQEYVQQLKEVVRKGKALLQESSKTTTPPSPSTFPKPGFLQIPQANSAEESAAIGEVFQRIWGAINNCCDNVEKMLGPRLENNNLHSVKDTVCRLLPHVVQLLSVFQKCLLFSPTELEPEMDIFCSLCFCLNTFFEHTNIPATPLPQINPGNMIIFVRQTETRTLLQIGLEQLNFGGVFLTACLYFFISSFSPWLSFNLVSVLHLSPRGCPSTLSLSFTFLPVAVLQPCLCPSPFSPWLSFNLVSVLHLSPRGCPSTLSLSSIFLPVAVLQPCLCPSPFSPWLSFNLVSVLHLSPRGCPSTLSLSSIFLPVAVLQPCLCPSPFSPWLSFNLVSVFHLSPRGCPSTLSLSFTFLPVAVLQPCLCPSPFSPWLSFNLVSVLHLSPRGCPSTLSLSSIFLPVAVLQPCLCPSPFSPWLSFNLVSVLHLSPRGCPSTLSLSSIFLPVAVLQPCLCPSPFSP
ncbi:hypothetical protein ACOMHN_016571 [Nucella lapillus]